jgi:hypothetical protein
MRKEWMMLHTKRALDVNRLVEHRNKMAGTSLLTDGSEKGRAGKPVQQRKLLDPPGFLTRQPCCTD